MKIFALKRQRNNVVENKSQILLSRVTQILIVIFLTVSCSSNEDLTNRSYGIEQDSGQIEVDCIGTFDEFAYFPDESDMNKALILPLSPWSIATQLPDPEDEKLIKNVYRTKILTTRRGNGEEEIWIQRLFNVLLTPRPQDEIMIFNVNSGEWKIFPDEIGETKISIASLFVMNDGSVWAKNFYHPANTDLLNDKIPLFSVYNEELEEFEFAENDLFIGDGQSPDGIYYPEIVLLDKNDIFWIFVQFDGLYSYDTKSDQVKKHLDISNFIVDDATMLSDGNIYFVPDNYPELYPEGVIKKYHRDTEEVEEISVPDESWLRFTSILVDENDNLWLSAVGRLAPDGTWHKLNSEYQVYTGLVIDFSGSDQTLWFSRFSDWDLNIDGLAWFDPDTGDGCWFTNIYTPVVEDDTGTMWLVAEETLYTFEMNP